VASVSLMELATPGSRHHRRRDRGVGRFLPPIVANFDVMRKLFTALLAAAAVAALAASGSAHAQSSRERAGVFMTRILREELNGQWGKQWSELHPAHQRLISRAQYVACSRALATDIATGHETYRVLGVRDEAIRVDRIPQRTAKLVTISFHSPLNKTTPTYHLHAVLVRGKWTWILGGRFLTAIESGQCLDGTPLSATH
jgi:hypothetical protein